MKKPHQNPIRLLAMAEKALGQRDAYAALTLARKILRRDARHVPALEVLARAEWQRGAFEEVVAATKRLIVLDPYNPGYRALQGAAEQALGRIGEAARTLASAQRLDGAVQFGIEGMLGEARAWQSRMIASLLAEDKSFAIRYAREPLVACQVYGFEMGVRKEEIRSWVHECPRPFIARARPS